MSTMRWGPGPVFVYECVTDARRWQTFAARSVGVAVLLLGMAAIAWWNEGLGQGVSARDYARLGEYYFYALIGLDLSLVMLAAPAATAGAICFDRARGTLTHILATDLSDSEIVVGKLAARFMPVLGLVACTWPVMAISSLLGGIDPVILTMAFVVIVAVAILGCSLAIALSVWAKKPDEVVAVVYTLWACMVLAYPVMWLMASRGLVVVPLRWLLMADPYYLAFAPYVAPGSVEAADYTLFITVALGASTALVLAAIWHMRPVSLRVIGAPKKSKKLIVLRRPSRRVSGPLLDANPVLWREWQRRRVWGWATALAAFFWCVTTAVCVIGAYAIWAYGVNPNKPLSTELAGLLAAVLLIVFGLLNLSAVAPTSLSEEGQQSSLDVLLVTPLSGQSIVLGKWLGSFRLVPRLTIGPGLMMLALATVYDRQVSMGFAVFRAGLMVATILVHGALVTGVGLALATWIKGQGRAIALSVCVFALVSVAWPITAYVVASWRNASGLAALSPVTAVALLADKGVIRGDIWSFHLWVTFWDVMVAYVAFGLTFLTVRSFDGCFGRAPEASRQSAFVEDVVKVLAGGIAIMCAAGAIVTWVNVLEPQSLSFEALLWLVGVMLSIMIVLSMLPAVATFAMPVDRSADTTTETLAHWWRAARLALGLALGPGLIALALATARAAVGTMPSATLPQNPSIFEPLNLGHRLIDVVLLVATICVQGAFISAFSLGLYVWTRRRDRAIALSAGLFTVAAIAWPLVVWHFSSAIAVNWLTMLSFLSVSTSLAAELVTREPQFPGLFAWAVFRIAFLVVVTIGLLWRTMRMLDRRVVQAQARDQCTHFDSAINQRAARARALVREVP
jgi:ABC-type transport system involved in multi-copper enzyme maturation permease subunit